MKAVCFSLNLLCCSLLLVSGLVAAEGDEPGKGSSPDGQQMSKAEQAFVDLLSGSTMVGSFSIDGQNVGPKEERYTISKVSKNAEGKWIVEARIKYGKVDVNVPVPVDVNWADDTPVLGVTNLSIPLVGSEFGSRILFDGDRYAGTWSHGKAGGHMWGRIEKASDEQEGGDGSQGASDQPGSSK